LGLHPSSYFLKHDFFKPAVLPFSGKEAPNLVHPIDPTILRHWALFSLSGKETPNLLDPLDRAMLSPGHSRNNNLLRYAPENRSSPRVVRKMATEKLKIN
jgi:hypothetical protein